MHSARSHTWLLRLSLQFEQALHVSLMPADMTAAAQDLNCLTTTAGDGEHWTGSGSLAVIRVHPAPVAQGSRKAWLLPSLPLVFSRKRVSRKQSLFPFYKQVIFRRTGDLVIETPASQPAHNNHSSIPGCQCSPKKQQRPWRNFQSQDLL